MVRHGFSEDKEHDKKLVIKSAEKLSNFRKLETRSEYFEFPMCKFLTLRQTMQSECDQTAALRTENVFFSTAERKRRGKFQYHYLLSSFLTSLII